MNKDLTSGKVTKWLLLMQEFSVTIINRPGKYNVVANYLSRLKNLGERIPVNDSFPDENLFAVSTNSPWFADIANYLVIGKKPPHLST